MIIGFILPNFYVSNRITAGENGERWTLKSIDYDSQELHILRTLIDDSSPSNHTFPTEIIPRGGTYLLLMPDTVGAYSMVWDSFDTLLGAIRQYLQVCSYAFILETVCLFDS